MSPGLLLLLAASTLAPPRDTLRILLVVDDTTARATLVRGISLGAEEAARTGALFGMSVQLRIAQARDAADASRAITASFGDARPALVIAAGSEAACDTVGAITARDSTPLLDAGCAASDAQRTPAAYSLGVPAADSAAGDSTRVVLWHWTLDRFGGEQLNERYRRRFADRMDSAAWAGWLAAKISLDLALHARSVAAPALLRELASPRARFDGQKGRPLWFGATDRRLVQPTYRVAGHGDAEHVVAEVAP
ncbi:MAG TPA: hypothetical protein VHM30_08475 [Gemmatimonadaceae bacterium]|nr:hypothetical protein [Gemmatimonadaceae bacterium]